MKQRGFTLIELLVAVLVLALLAGLGWRGLDSVARSRDAAHARQQQVVQLQMALLQLQADLRQASDAGAGLPALSRSAAGDLLIVRRAGPDASLQLVRWGVRDGRWLRWAVDGAGRGALLGARNAAAGPGLVMLDAVVAVELQVWRQSGSDWGAPRGAWSALAVASDLQDAAGLGAGTPMANLPTPPALRLVLRSNNPAFGGTLTREFLLENRL